MAVWERKTRNRVKHPGPEMTMGAKGMGTAVSFKDPSGHLLEIKTY